jgi:hypothetical protein
VLFIFKKNEKRKKREKGKKEKAGGDKEIYAFLDLFDFGPSGTNIS